ncbi:hypothetical protein [Brevundimonas sp.]|uniref:hypothetical protein n=1 Tax=Brevundimonas sp. TaxID=1871086 RepID=UPI002D30A0C7|nr:hypothetical protein [Brevundimonas sp.]HYD28904.1 hypothetical protein [Brevundimonas sp.]
MIRNLLSRRAGRLALYAVIAILTALVMRSVTATFAVAVFACVALVVVVLDIAIRRTLRRPTARALSPQEITEYRAGISGKCRYCPAVASGHVRRVGGRDPVLHCDRHIGYAVAEATR